MAMLSTLGVPRSDWISAAPSALLVGVVGAVSGIGMAWPIALWRSISAALILPMCLSPMSLPGISWLMPMSLIVRRGTGSIGGIAAARPGRRASVPRA